MHVNGAGLNSLCLDGVNTGGEQFSIVAGQVSGVTVRIIIYKTV